MFKHLHFSDLSLANESIDYASIWQTIMQPSSILMPWRNQKIEQLRVNLLF